MHILSSVLVTALAAVGARAGKEYEQNQLGVPLFPNGLDLPASLIPPSLTSQGQCSDRKYFKGENFLLGDSELGEGCVLPDADAFKIPNRKSGSDYVSFNQSTWDVSINRPGKNNTLINIISPRRKPVYFCYSKGYLGRDTEPPKITEEPEPTVTDDDVDPGDVLDEEVDSTGADAAYSTFFEDVAFIRSVEIPGKFLSKVDKDVMAYSLITRNVPNPYDLELLFRRYSDAFEQQILITFLDENKDIIDIYNSTIASAFDGIEDFDFIPAGTRRIDLVFLTNYPYFALGQITLMIYQAGAEFRQQAQIVANISFVAALSFVLVAPLLLLLEDVIKKRAKKVKIVDLVHYQGPKYIRAITFTMMMALLYMVFEWLRASNSNSDTATIPIMGGLSASAFQRQPTLKTLKSLIFIGIFLSVGVIFWPIFVCYAHAADGSRLGAALGSLVCLNLICLRFSLIYLTANPTKGYNRKVASELPEAFSYVCVLVYFVVNSFFPNYIENTYRKTYFKDLIYVRTLLRPISVPENPQPAEEEEKSFFKRTFSLFIKRDNRPIWVRGRKKTKGIYQEINHFLRYARTPVRMAAAIMMMCLFTYFLLITIVFTVLDQNASLSCLLAIFGDYFNRAFSNVSVLLAAFTATQNFGSSLSQTLFDLGTQIQSETEGNIVDMFYILILGSVVVAMTLSFALLIYNIFDFCLAFQRDLNELRVGNYSRIENVTQASTSLAVQFMGVQIGFAFMGSLYLMTILQTICFLVAMAVRFKFIRDLIWQFLFQNGLLIISTFVSVILSYLQQYLIDFFFVTKHKQPYRDVPEGALVKADKKSSKDDEPMVTINTKFWLSRVVAYNHIDYFFLFPNLITGLLSFITNLVKMILGSAIYAYRLDKKTEYTVPILGNKSTLYQSWLIQEHHHTNPVLLIFIHLLHTWAKHPVTTTTSSPDMPKYVGGPRDPFSSLTPRQQRTRRIQQKWGVFYTLVRNPQLAKFRKHVVRQTYLKEYIAHTEAPLMREQEVQRVREKNERYEQAKAALRTREVEIWTLARKNGQKDDIEKVKKGSSTENDMQLINGGATMLAAEPLKIGGNVVPGQQASSSSPTSPRSKTTPPPVYQQPPSPVHQQPQQSAYQQPQSPQRQKPQSPIYQHPTAAYQQPQYQKPQSPVYTQPTYQQPVYQQLPQQPSYQQPQAPFYTPPQQPQYIQPQYVQPPEQPTSPILTAPQRTAPPRRQSQITKR
ncbi:hypothetical protein HDU97_000929 [Phlyctochytrium planicorne]|nr:hypothetical protein HDU97_000929 [Phlyctochytrium planicorne]